MSNYYLSKCCDAQVEYSKNPYDGILYKCCSGCGDTCGVCPITDNQ